MVSTLVAAVVGIGFTLLFINTLNLWAAIIGTLLSYFTIASIRLWDVRRFIKFKINWFVFLMNVIIASVQVYLVTIGWHMVVVSIICLVAFVAVNASTIIKTLKKGSN
jgi:O-antigen/teichoic acid export membrane protein